MYQDFVLLGLMMARCSWNMLPSFEFCWLYRVFHDLWTLLQEVIS